MWELLFRYTYPNKIISMFYNFDSNNMLATLKKVNLDIDPLSSDTEIIRY